MEVVIFWTVFRLSSLTSSLPFLPRSIWLQDHITHNLKWVERLHKEANAEMTILIIHRTNKWSATRIVHYTIQHTVLKFASFAFEFVMRISYRHVSPTFMFPHNVELVRKRGEIQMQDQNQIQIQRISTQVCAQISQHLRYVWQSEVHHITCAQRESIESMPWDQVNWYKPHWIQIQIQIRWHSASSFDCVSCFICRLDAFAVGCIGGVCSCSCFMFHDHLSCWPTYTHLHSLPCERQTSGVFGTTPVETDRLPGRQWQTDQWFWVISLPMFAKSGLFEICLFY